MRVEEFLSYSPETGELYWTADCGNVKAGSPAGCRNALGYLVVRFNRKLFLAHRIAWRLHYGKWPDTGLDHINGDRADNRACNLREVSQRENLKNSKRYSSNKTGCTGVSWSKPNKKYAVRIKSVEKYLHLGLYEDFFEACCARKSAEIKHNYHPNHGRVGNGGSEISRPT